MDRLERIKEGFKRHTVGWLPGSEIAWLIAQVTELRQERLAAINEADAYREERDAATAENHRLAALIGSVATEAEVARREVGRLGQEVDNLAAIADGFATEAEVLKRGISAQGKLVQDAKELIVTLKRERDELQAKLALAKHRATSRVGKVQTR